MGRFDFAKIYGEDAVPKRQTIEQEIFRLRADSKAMRAAIRETLNRARNEDGECLLGYIVKPLEDFAQEIVEVALVDQEMFIELVKKGEK